MNFGASARSRRTTTRFVKSSERCQHGAVFCFYPRWTKTNREVLCAKLENLEKAGSRLRVWMIDEARFGLHTQMRRVWTRNGQRPVVTRQIKSEWDYLYGALSLVGGNAHFAYLPGANLEWDASYFSDLAETDTEAIHVIILDQAGFHLRDGDARLPKRVRIIDLRLYSPEINPCEQLWDIVKDDIANRVHATVTKLRAHMKATLRRFWECPGSVLRLIGRLWLQARPTSRVL